MKNSAKKLLLKPFLVVFLAALTLIMPLFLLTSCKVDYREDSEIYSCYYYSLNGEDVTHKFSYYTLELRTDGKLITRYKMGSTRDTGKDDYSIKDSSLLVTAYYTTKTHDLAGNELIINDYPDSNTHLLIKFRLTQTQKPSSETIYSCYELTSDGTSAFNELRYFVISFGENDVFKLWQRESNSDKKVVVGSYAATDNGYIANYTHNETDETLLFTFEEDKLCLHRQEEEVSKTYYFVKTQENGTLLPF